MKYFNPSYWFKLWLLSAPLFNDKTQGINAKSIDNKKIKDWVSNNTSLESINEANIFTNTSNYQPYNLNETNQNINPIYQAEVEKSTHKHRHQKSRRIKKQVTPHPKPSKAILQLNEKLIIDKNNRREYMNSFNNWINSLVTNGILREILNLNSLVRPEFHVSEDNSFFSLNNENYGYFRLPVEIRGEQDGQSFFRNLELVFRTDNLYVQGFIVNNNYYHFDFTEIYEGRNYINVQQNELTENQRMLLQMWNRQSANVKDDSIPLLTQIVGIQSIQLTRIRPDYPHMIPLEDEDITWETIFNSFLRLTNDINANTERPLGNLARALGQVIFVTAESLRFWAIHSEILDLLIINNSSIRLGRNQNNVYFNLLVTWNDESRIQNLSIERINNPLIFGQQIDVSRYFIGNVRQYLRDLLQTIANQPINAITNILGNSNVRVLLGVFIRPSLNNCRRQKRDLENDYWHKELCDLKPKIDNIQGEITVVNILDKDLKSNNLNKEDIFVGTTEGLYLIRENGISLKADNIDNEVTSIKEFGIGNFYVSTKDEQIYFLNTKLINNNYPLIAEGLFDFNLKSSDLNKELKIYYNTQKSNIRFQTNYKLSNTDNKYGKFESPINLKTINPIDNYKKIDFLGNNLETFMTWGNDRYWGTSIKDYVQNKNLDDLFINKEITNNDEAISNSNKLLQDLCDKSFIAGMCVNQKFGLSFYWNNKDYFLQIIASQYIRLWSSYSGGTMQIALGNGIRLYNDYEELEQNVQFHKVELTNITEINDFTLETTTEIINSTELSNQETTTELTTLSTTEENIDVISTTQWDKNISNLINLEQHLPIDNKTNFVTSNITSL